MDRMAESTPLCFQQMIGSGAKFALRGVYGLANAVCRIDLVVDAETQEVLPFESS